MKFVNERRGTGGWSTEVLTLEDFAARRLTGNGSRTEFVLARLLGALAEKGVLTDGEFLAVLGVDSADVQIGRRYE